MRSSTSHSTKHDFRRHSFAHPETQALRTEGRGYPLLGASFCSDLGSLARVTPALLCGLKEFVMCFEIAMSIRKWYGKLCCAIKIGKKSLEKKLRPREVLSHSRECPKPGRENWSTSPIPQPWSRTTFLCASPNTNVPVTLQCYSTNQV